MLYKLVLGPTPILHINVHENPLTTFGILINFNDNWVSGSPPKYLSVHYLTMSAYPHILKKIKFFKKNKKIKIYWVSGSPPMLYKLVLGPAPILHTNDYEDPLRTFGFTDILKLFN